MYNPELEIDIYYAISVTSFASRLPTYLETLDKDEIAVAERFKFAELRTRYIISHGILRQLLAERVHEPAVSLRIEKAEFGKPFLPDYSELSFNMSHTEDILVIAISSQCQLGVDVECYQARRACAGLVKKCFAPEEADYWHGLESAERSRAFYPFWVKKEALVKAIGKGITLGLDQCVVNPENLNTFLRVPESGGLADKWQIHSWDLSENITGAVVCDKKNSISRLISLYTHYAE